ncbi:hypothetical protein VW35_06620 [Devosia soli]|uniref:Uncharacterized protein n=1 Tax=Devosia soli TaxID=361041 RepID=A0A0F5LEV9_9HYPH|nr:hypothetical protein VW35_06620 [Devosia soli]
MPSAVSLGSGRRRDPQLGVAIRGPREEEFGARLSDTPYMYSTDLVGNPVTDMSAMHFCRARGAKRRKTRPPMQPEHGLMKGEKEMASPEGRAKPLGGSGRNPKEGTQRDAREEEKQPRCDVLDIWAACLFANQVSDMSGMHFVHAGANTITNSMAKPHGVTC